MDLTWALVAMAFVVAAFVKGTTAMGFPLIATPMVAMVVDVRTTYALLLAPNILMDLFQIGRRGLPWPVWRRLAVLLLAVVPGVFLGTRILVAVPERVIDVALSGMIVAFLASERLHVAPRVPAAAERWLGPVVGFVGGVLNGVTNVFGPLAAIYLLALDLSKREFVKAMSSIFLAAKISQLAAISSSGIYSASLLWWSALLTLVALGAFWVGLHTQDRVPQHAFRRILHGLLFVMALFFVYRGIVG
jgi:uncharacterized membrane protein YfcA